MSPVTIDDVEAAAERLAGTDIVQRTPVERSRSLSERCGADVRLKMEHLQRTGSFKTRGAYNAISLAIGGSGAGSDEPAIERVVAASAGNHAQGVALAAADAGIDATIVMPESAPAAKIEATRGYGAEVVLRGSAFPEAMAHAQTLVDDSGTRFVHAFDDPDVVAGQGTLGLEVLDQVPDADTVLVPVGGGGLAGGVAAAVKARSPETRVVGVQTEGASTLSESLAAGELVAREEPDTIADGIATGGLSDLTFGLLREHLDDVVVVSDDDVAAAILLLLERAKQLIEGAGATAAAALLNDDAVDELGLAGETVVPLLCGGNIDVTTLKEVVTHALVDRDQLIELAVRIDDTPGTMGEISTLIGAERANIRTVRHERSRPDLPVGDADLVFEVETNGPAHVDRVLRAVREAGYEVEWTTQEA
ncbi:threonine ammonia-lyase [Halorubrum lipolyticum]|uniref:threonine ammonia-lyase n=1 Tax=Halorubrum lipolyticum DSM 21995 TaxID=1227482 RepID=M0NYA6_9EURY|nr:threonine ammonia-lyase [Halorubrum lipolyticum]EMA61520.1 threonine dehydratase [Halorubrum lipolyticum DSM 21995]